MNDKIFYLPLIGAAVLATACQTSQPEQQHYGADASEPRATQATTLEQQAHEQVEQAAVQADEPQARPMTRVWTIQMTESGAITDDGMLATVDEVMAEIGSWQHVERIEITGHTDDVGNEAANLVLSVQRADAVAEQLLMAGLDEELIEHRGEGEASPLVENDSEQSRAKNRRVEIRVSGLAVPAAEGELARHHDDEFSIVISPQGGLQ